MSRSGAVQAVTHFHILYTHSFALTCAHTIDRKPYSTHTPLHVFDREATPTQYSTNAAAEIESFLLVPVSRPRLITVKPQCNCSWGPREAMFI